MTHQKDRIYLSPPHMTGSEIQYVDQAFKQNWIAPLGPNVDAFEEMLAAYCGVKSASALSSGTAGLHLALILLGVEKGDEIITSTFTFSATVNPIIYQGAKPIFIDSEYQTWNMDPDLLEKALACKARKNEIGKIKAIIVVDLYGMPANMERISAIAKRYQIPIIEDAAEALGSKYKNKFCGSFGIISVLSFNGNKIITTSGGGALLSNDEVLVRKSRFLATQARDPAPHYQHSEVGYNYRMSNVLAGIGRGQLEGLEEKILAKRRINGWYREQFSAFPGVQFQKEPSSDYYSNYWLTCITINPKLINLDNEKIRIALERENIESRPLWKPMHLQPVFQGFKVYENGVSETLFKTGLCLPSGTNLSDADMERILNTFKRIIQEKK